MKTVFIYDHRGLVEQPPRRYHGRAIDAHFYRACYITRCCQITAPRLYFSTRVSSVIDYRLLTPERFILFQPERRRTIYYLKDFTPISCKSR